MSQAGFRTAACVPNAAEAFTTPGLPERSPGSLPKCRHQIEARDFCRTPHAKSPTTGSSGHSHSGSFVRIPGHGWWIFCFFGTPPKRRPLFRSSLSGRRPREQAPRPDALVTPFWAASWNSRGREVPVSVQNGTQVPSASSDDPGSPVALTSPQGAAAQLLAQARSLGRLIGAP